MKPNDYGSIAVHNNKMYYVYSMSFYEYSNSTWKSLGNLNFNSGSLHKLVSLNNELHLFGGSTDKRRHVALQTQLYRKVI